MGVRNFLYDRKTQPGPRSSKPGFWGTVESFEDTLSLSRHDGRSFITHFGDNLCFGNADSDLDRRIGNRVLDRIIEKLRERPLHELTVSTYGHFIVGRPELKSFALARLIEAFDGGRQQAGKKKRLALRLKVGTLELRSSQQMRGQIV